MKNLRKIIEKYSNIEYNSYNYSIGGGLDDSKFASNRHEDAKQDEGKLTIGKATAMFIKATGYDIDLVKEIIHYAVPNPEWHHAGMLPKSHGGGMKKTYFLNASEIVKIASEWDSLIEKLEISKSEKRLADERKKDIESRRQDFLSKNAVKIVRATSKPNFFYEIDREMNGKFGWFSSYGKSYNLPEYYTGWKFENEEKYNEFLNIN